MESLLAIGDAQAREGKLISGDTVFARLKAKSDAKRGAGGA